jgi:hypothetical protein
MRASSYTWLPAGRAELHHAAVVGGLHDAEARVLEEVRPEVEARPTLASSPQEIHEPPRIIWCWPS